MATPTTGTGVPTAPAPFPPFETEHFASQLFWLVLAFVILYALMAKVALPRVASILKTREDTVSGDLAAAQRFREDSEAAVAAYEKSLADARHNAQTIANETHERFAKEADDNRKALEARLHAKLADAERSIAATKTSAMSNVRGVAVDTASAIVERLIGQAPATPRAEQAVDRVLKN